DALVVRSETRVTAPIIEAGSKLRVVGRAGVGVDNIDVPAATRRGILVVNAPRGNIIAAAEHTIALLFALARWVPQADASVKRGEWTRQMFLGTEVRGKTLGVIGLGIVDEKALLEALRSGRLAAAAADVFETEPPGENPLLALPNFIATPHIAASTVEAQVSVAFDVAEEVAAVLAGDLPRFAVNAPALPPEELAYLRPFADLTERLAALHAQLFGGRVSVIELDCEGELAEHDVTL